MKRVLVKSVFDSFEYVMDHFYPAGLKELAARNDSYAVISIQDGSCGGFGFQFTESESCKEVLTIYFDDIEEETEGAILFTDEMADEIIAFIKRNKNVDSLLIHCFAGQSRSRAVGAFAVEMLKGDNSRYFENGIPNMYVYEKLKRRFENGQN